MEPEIWREAANRKAVMSHIGTLWRSATTQLYINDTSMETMRTVNVRAIVSQGDLVVLATLADVDGRGDGQRTPTLIESLR